MPIPIVTGEALHTKEAFFECLAKRAADILNPDICVVGGITAMLDIAAMAQPQAVVMAPHNYNSTLMGLAATVHLSAVIPNFRIAEYFVNFQDLCRDISTCRSRWRAVGSTCRPRPVSASTSTSTNCGRIRTRRRRPMVSANIGRNIRAKATRLACADNDALGRRRPRGCARNRIPRGADRSSRTLKNQRRYLIGVRSLALRAGSRCWPAGLFISGVEPPRAGPPACRPGSARPRSSSGFSPPPAIRPAAPVCRHSGKQAPSSTGRAHRAHRPWKG